MMDDAALLPVKLNILSPLGSFISVIIYTMEVNVAPDVREMHNVLHQSKKVSYATLCAML